MKRIPIYFVLIAILLLMIPINNCTSAGRREILIHLHQLGAMGNILEEEHAFEIQDNTVYGYWSIGIKKGFLVDKLGVATNYYLMIDNAPFPIESNDYHDNHFISHIPEKYNADEILKAVIHTEKEGVHDRHAFRDAYTIKNLVIFGEEEKFGTKNHEIELFSYLTMKMARFPFIVAQNHQPYEPEYIRSNHGFLFECSDYLEMKEAQGSVHDTLKALSDQPGAKRSLITSLIETTQGQISFIPPITIVSPFDGTTVSDVVTILAEVRAYIPSTSYGFLINDDLVELTHRGDQSYIWDTGNYPTGTYTIVAVVHDESGNTGRSKPITVGINMFRAHYLPNDADEGVPPVDPEFYEIGTQLTVLSPEPTFARDSFVYLGWLDHPDSSKVIIPGDTVSMEEGGLFFYPCWSNFPVLTINTVNEEPILNKVDWVFAQYFLRDVDGSCIDGFFDIRGRGNSTWAAPKKPFNIRLPRKQSILGMPEHTRWVLLANYYDKTLLRTEVAHTLGREVYTNLAWTPDPGKHIHLILNGSYRGAYQLTEQIRIDENRVNIPEISDRNPAGGYIIEVCARMQEELNFRTTQGVSINLKRPGLVSEPIWEEIKAHIQMVEDILYSDNFADPDEGYRKYLDVESFIDWYLVNEISKNHDAVYFSSVYMYFDPITQKIHKGPLWDFDLAFGNYVFSQQDSNNPEGFRIRNTRWIRRLFEDPYFTDLVVDRWNVTKSDLLKTLNRILNARKEELLELQKYNFGTWNINKQYGQVVPKGSHEKEIIFMKEWTEERIVWLDIAINELYSDIF